MKQTRLFLVSVFMCLPLATSASAQLDNDIKAIDSAETVEQLEAAKDTAFSNLKTEYKEKGMSDYEIDAILSDYQSKAQSDSSSDSGESANAENADADKKPDEEQKQENVVDQSKVDEAQKKLDQAKANEQSTANRMLGGLTMAATGIGGMQLAQGIAEKQADAEADKDMNAYIATMRCTYGSGKSVPFGNEPVELPGKEIPKLETLRSEYVNLAQDLKERKEALDMRPGIESELIMNKDEMGLYDDENVGITGGHYASRYRAAQGNEEDQKELAAQKKEAKNRMIAGGVLAGAGVVGGMVGDSLINGKLGDMIKQSKIAKEMKQATPEENKQAVQKLTDKAKEAGVADPSYVSQWKLEDLNIGAYSEYIDKLEFKPEVKGQKLETLCPKLDLDHANECADKLLTKESSDAIKSAIGGVMGDGHGLGGLGSSGLGSLAGMIGGGGNNGGGQ